MPDIFPSTQRARTARLRATALAAAALGALLSTAGAAHASPVDDLRRGTSLWLREGWTVIDGNPLGATDWFASKAAGSLDFDVWLPDLGVDYPLMIHATGSGSGSTVTWTFDTELPEPILVGLTSYATHVAGTLVAEVERIRGNDLPMCEEGACPYSVRLVGAPAASIHVTGHDLFSGWTMDLETRFEGLGGGPRPALRDIGFTAPTAALCARTHARTYTGRVRLTDAATTGGAWVDVWSSDPNIFPSQRVHIPEGERSADFNTTLRGNFEGSLMVWAGAGGTVIPHPILIMPPTVCSVADSRWSLTDLTPLFPCPNCVTSLALANDGALLANVSGKAFVSRDGAAPVPVEQVVGGPVGLASWSAQGDLAWSAAPTDSNSYLVRDLGLGAPQHATQGFKTASVSVLGIALGSVPDGNANRPAYFDGKKIVRIGGALDGKLLAANNAGLAVGEVLDKGVPRGFVLEANGVELFPKSGMRVVAINQAGDIVGAVESGSKTSPLARWAGSSNVSTLPLPAGYTSARARAVDENGIVAIQASAANRPDVVHLYRKNEGYGAIKVDGQRKVVVRDVLGANASMDLAARGTLDGKDAVFVLTRKN